MYPLGGAVICSSVDVFFMESLFVEDVGENSEVPTSPRNNIATSFLTSRYSVSFKCLYPYIIESAKWYRTVFYLLNFQ